MYASVNPAEAELNRTIATLMAYRPTPPAQVERLFAVATRKRLESTVLAALYGAAIGAAAGALLNLPVFGWFALAIVLAGSGAVARWIARSMRVRHLLARYRHLSNSEVREIDAIATNYPELRFVVAQWARNPDVMQRGIELEMLRNAAAVAKRAHEAASLACGDVGELAHARN